MPSHGNPERPVEARAMLPPLKALQMLFRTGALAVIAAACFAQSSFKPRIPTIWNDRDIAEMEIPVSNPAYSPHHVSAEYYYRIPVRPIYRTYPLYAPGRAPEGYLDSLRQKEPEIVFDASRLRVRQDWVRAGEAVLPIKSNENVSLSATRFLSSDNNERRLEPPLDAHPHRSFRDLVLGNTIGGHRFDCAPLFRVDLFG